jgi:hypothetical protein
VQTTLASADEYRPTTQLVQVDDADAAVVVE